MKYKVCWLILMFYSILISAQDPKTGFEVNAVISDTLTFKNNISRDYLPSILQSKNTIEIRLITQGYKFDDLQYLTLSYNTHWSAAFYKYSILTGKLELKDTKPKISLDSIFSILVNNNIFSLPGQKYLEIDKLIYYPNKDLFESRVPEVVDGVFYSIEFKIGNRFRKYGYSNPYLFLEYYPQVKELKEFINIIEVLNNFVLK